MLVFSLVTLSNALQMELGMQMELDMQSKALTFESYEGPNHPVKPVALDQALQNVRRLPNEIRAMLTNKNATLPKVSEHDRARALKAMKDKEESKQLFLHSKTTHGSHLIISAGSGMGMDPNAVDPTADPKYATLDKVRQTLNDLYQTTMQEKDIEAADCFEAEYSLKMQIHVNTGLRVTLAAAIAQARGEILTANGNINTANANIAQLKGELATHNHECNRVLTLANEKREIIESDLSVAETVQNMTDCDKMEANAASMAFFQCMVHTDTGASHVQLKGKAGELMKKFKSKEAVRAMMMAARMSLGAATDPDAGKNPEIPAGNFSADEYEEWLKLPQDGDWMNDVGITKLPSDCKALDGKINLGEKCPILADAVGQMVGEVSTALYDTNMFIKKTEEHCQTVRENLETQISEWETTLSNAQIALAEATQKLNVNNEGLSRRVEEFKTLRDELIMRMKDCNANLRQLFEEMCGLITIRNELFKMSGVNVYMQDCQVGEWVAGDCSVTCGGGQQTFTRDVVQEQYFGSACPPLSKIGLCNEDPCPVDCEYDDDWSQWSACSADCGGGVMQRNRHIRTRDQNGGIQCEATDESITCNAGSCDYDCELGEWTEWAGCSKMCNSGVQTRRKLVVKEAAGSGVCADKDEQDPSAEGGGARFELRPCNTQHCLANLDCNSKLDIAFVLDGSGSIGSSGWTATQRFAKQMIDRIYLSYDDGAIASVILYSWDVDVVHAMTDDKASLDTALDGMRFPRSLTATGEAIRSALNQFSSGGRAGVTGAIFVVTDGNPTWRTSADEAAAEAKRQGVRLFFVGVGNNINYNAMYTWASVPSTENVEYVENYNELTQKISNMIADLCPILECSESFTDSLERDYHGCQSQTVSGITCQAWNSQSPHVHGWGPHMDNGQGQPLYPTLGNHNFCRNPDNDPGGIWCLTSDSQKWWDYCDPRSTTSIPELPM